MKRILVLLALFGSMLTGASAQQRDQSGMPVMDELPQRMEIPVSRAYPPYVHDEQPFNGSAAAVEDYVWHSRHFFRLGVDDEGASFDSNVVNLYFPLGLGKDNQNNNVEIRGSGQIFAPSIIYPWFASVYADTTNTVYRQDYIEQFRDAGAFTIDTIVARFFRNPNGPSNPFGGTFVVYTTPSTFNATTYFNGTAYKDNGFVGFRSTMPKVFEAEITPEGLDTTVEGGSINATLFKGMGQGGGPLVFNKDAAAVIMYINDFAPAIPSEQYPRVDPNDTREWEVFRAFSEERHDHARLDSFKVLSVVLRRAVTPQEQKLDTIWSTWQALSLGGRAAIIDMSISLAGTVDLGTSGVKYHYGVTAEGQGLGNVTPNPATISSRLPFSLTEVSNIKIDMFDLSGEKVAELVDARYVPGKYSVALPIDQLENGMYMIRMTANDNVYTMKLSVSK